MRTRHLMAGAALAVAGIAAAAPAVAEPDHVQTLRTICQSKDGISVPRPGWWRSRCQDARSDGTDRGANQAFMICTMQMDGTFFSQTDENGTDWICF